MRKGTPTIERLDVCDMDFPPTLSLPSFPNLRALHMRRRVSSCVLERLAAYRAPRLQWVLLEQCFGLREVTFDSPNLSWCGVTGTKAPVRVISRRDCPLMARGESTLAPDDAGSSLHGI